MPSLGGDSYFSPWPADTTYGPTCQSPRQVHSIPGEIISDGRGTAIYLEAMVGQGAHGVIFRGRDESNPLCPRWVAVKEFHTKEFWNAEFRNIEYIQQSLPHSSMVKASASFISGSRYYVLYPLARESLYTRLKTPVGEVEPRQILQNFSNLLEGITCLNKLGYHRDIKPSNILCMFDNSYVLVDFGTFARISDSVTPMTVGDCNWSEYTPPFDEKLGESTDSWSVGCVGVILLVWIVYGPSGVENFRKTRRSYQRQHSTDIVQESVPFFHVRGGLNPAVDEVLKTLENHYQEVVNILRGMLSMNCVTRLTAAQAADQLNIYMRCTENSKFESPASTISVVTVQDGVCIRLHSCC
ncbi:kinase-like protein [Wilcoxina mikolae CBS 423.85]|nr:kinase-like protein [Wilcoxina mikolae CBS 423.85]